MGPASPSSLGMRPSSLGMGPQRKGDRGRGDSVFPQGRRTHRTLDSRLLVDAGEGGCSVPVASPVSPSPLSSRAPLGGIIAASGMVLGSCGEPQTRSPLRSLSAGFLGCPSRQAAACALGPCPAGSCPPPGPPPRPAQRPRPPRPRSRASSRDCRPPQRAGGPRLAPLEDGRRRLGAGLRGLLWGTQGGRGPRPPRQCRRSGVPHGVW